MRFRTPRRGAFALIATLVLMGLIAVVVVAYLGNTQSDRSTSTAYAHRLRAKTVGDGGLAAAVRLLYDNTKAGNYITAMAPPSSPPVIRSELYRPDDSAVSDDFLRIDNAIGDVLASKTDAPDTPIPTAQVDPRPAAAVLPPPVAGAGFGIPDPGFTATNSFDFNQVVRVGSSDTARLVNPAVPVQPAFGQWIRVRSSAGELIGRYAFFIEDESMKVNINASGNNLAGGSSPNKRINDLVLPIPLPTPTSQVQEVNPSAALPGTADQGAAINTLLAARPPVAPPAISALPSKGTVALLDQWKATYPEYAHVITASSKDDNTTARGWLRMNVNQIVKDAETAGTATAKADAAKKISDWIKTAWTGPTAIADLKQDAGGRRYQLYNEDRLRLQIAATIVDYIDTDNLPTDLGDVEPEPGGIAVPVLGIERIPQLAAVMVIYRAEDRATAPPTPGSTAPRASAKLSMKLRFNFINLFDSALPLEQFITKIEVKGIPVVSKNSEVVFDKEDTPYSIPVGDLKPVAGSGSQVPAGQNGISGTAGSGVRSFETGWLVENEVVTFRDTSGNATLSPVGQVVVTVRGPGDARVDATAMTWSDVTTGFRQSGTNTPGSSSAGDFLRDDPAAKPGMSRQIAAIFVMESSVPSGGGTLYREFADPRHRPKLLNDRWRKIGRTDTQSAFTASALDARVDQADMDLRTAAVDWYDRTTNRPLAFIRNGPMLSTGELGHIAASEYPWRSLYLQHPDRPAHSTSAIVVDEVAAKRRMGAVDWVLPDLFRVSATDTRLGSININTRVDVSGEQRVLDSLLLGVLIGEQAGTQQSLTAAKAKLMTTSSGNGSATAVADRRLSGTNQPDNTPIRPFFQIGEVAPVLSRLLSASMLHPIESGAGGTNRSTVVYSALRSKPDDINEANENYRSDMHVEQAFREVAESITTRGNVFRILYVGQSVRDIDKNGIVGPNETAAEYLGEAFVERIPVFTAVAGTMKTTDSRYKILSQRTITE